MDSRNPLGIELPLNPAAALVSQGHAVLRIENDSMLQVATQRPRDEQAVVTGALRELDLIPEEAGKAFYSIPYRERQPDGSTKVVKVEGPSVKTAMALARRWGNCTTGARVLNEDKEGFDLEGVFIDLESNFRVSRPFRVSKWYKPRAGGAQLLSVDRQQQAVQAGASKALRNAILAGLPAYLVSAYEKKARALVAGNLDAAADKKTVDAVLRAFEKWQVTEEQLATYTGLPVAGWTGTEVADLRGLWNAINDGQTSVEEAFRGEAALAQTGGPGVSILTPETLSAGTVTGENAPREADVLKTEHGQRLAAILTLKDALALKGEPWADYVTTYIAKGADIAKADVAQLADLQAALEKAAKAKK
jgi:hypothetical protein